MLSLNSDRYSGLTFNLRLISLEEGSMNLIITNSCKKKKKYIAIRTVPKTNRNKLIPLTHLYMTVYFLGFAQAHYKTVVCSI